MYQSENNDFFLYLITYEELKISYDSRYKSDMMLRTGPTVKTADNSMLCQLLKDAKPRGLISCNKLTIAVDTKSVVMVTTSKAVGDGGTRRACQLHLYYAGAH